LKAHFEHILLLGSPAREFLKHLTKVLDERYEQQRTIFQMSPDGSGFTVLYSFTGGTDGAGPYAGLIQGPDGTLYGTTLFGGTVATGECGTGCGTVFQLTLSPNVPKRR
jgi:hypothetical protein